MGWFSSALGLDLVTGGAASATVIGTGGAILGDPTTNAVAGTVGGKYLTDYTISSGGGSMGKKGGSSAPSVDPNVGIAQQRMAGVAERQQEWYENTMYPWLKSQTEYTNQQNDRYQSMLEQNYNYWQDYATKQAEKSNAITDSLWSRYKEKYVPVEDALIKEADEYNTSAEAERQAGLAIADTQANYLSQRRALQQNMAQYGISPTSGQYLAQQNALNVNQAAARAAAANQARNAAQELGWTKKYQVAALGQNTLNLTGSMSQNSTNTGANAANSAINSAANINQSSLSNVQNLANIGLNSYASLGNAWGNYGNLGMQVSNYNANNYWNQQSQNSSMFGSSMGMIGTVGAGIAVAI